MKLISIFALALLCSCQGLFIHNQSTRAKVAQRIQERKSWLPTTPPGATPQQKEALDFLYAYMPMGDVADYPVDLFMINVSSAIAAKTEMGWNVPEDIFLHFVLPVRVNNEALDISRVDFYAQLKERVKGLSMCDAILEVNHWCHEKVVYTPTDSRTSSPWATLRSAQGRCGEESTFTVAALRAVGIPARQVYTPRWAHSDDNHAWVEAWADGKWYYIGACEPEAVLNTGWFDAPAARALLMHTKVFGDYQSQDSVISKTDCYTEINVTANYADMAPVKVSVVSAQGEAVANATVDFGIYNYAEFYPAARRIADSEGHTTLSAGLGSMVVWANDGVNYGFKQVNFGQDTLVVITLDNANGSYNFDITPPVEKVITKDISADARAVNNLRLVREDSIRGAYTATFIQSGALLAAQIGADSVRVTKYMVASRGNHDQIEKFLRSVPADKMSVALDLLEVISDKDLRDTPAAVLTDHLDGAFEYRDRKFFVDYILNPRVGNELLTPYRARMREVGACGSAEAIMASASDIEIHPELNPAAIPISPLGVHNLRKADQTALDTYSIALLRSKGIAARHEPITENLQYYDDNTDKWINLRAALVGEKGLLNLTYKGKDNPKYETHFTLAKLHDGLFETIDMSRSAITNTSDGSTYKSLFTKPLPLEVGTYRLTSGTRLASGAVLSQVEIFDVTLGQTTTRELVMRQDETKVRVIGEMNPESLFVKGGADAAASILATTGRGYFILALVGAKQEPTNHAMRDLAEHKEFLESWGRSIVLVFRDEAQYEKFDPSEFGKLPSTVVLGYDNQGQTYDMVTQKMKIQSKSALPIFMVADTFGRVVFVSQGYKIGLGEQLKKVIENI